MFNANLVLLVFSREALTLFFFNFVLLIRLFYIFLEVHVSLLEGADSRFCLHRKPNMDFITMITGDVLDSNI